MTQQVSSFNPRPTAFLGVLAWAATEARLKGVPFCPVKPTLVLDGCAIEWLSEGFDAMSPTHRHTVDVTDLATGEVFTFPKVWRKQRTYKATGRSTVSYSTPLGKFGTYDEVNAALVAEVQRRVAERPAPVVEVAEVLAAPERHAQPEQRHYAQGVETVACHECGALVPADETHDMTIGADDVEICGECAEGWRDEMAQDGPHQQVEQQQAQAVAVAVAGEDMPPLKPHSQAAKLLRAACAEPMGAGELCARAEIVVSTYTARNLDTLVARKFLAMQEPGGRVRRVYALTPEGETELDRLFRAAR